MRLGRLQLVFDLVDAGPFKRLHGQQRIDESR